MNWFILLGFVLTFTAVVLPQGHAEIIEKKHPGYLDSVMDERHQHIEEMVVVPTPFEDKMSLKEVIFDERLTTEFRSRYEDQFGRTEAEQIIFAPNRFDVYEYNNNRDNTGLGVSYKEDRQNKRRFAEYMMRRLSEHHVDQYFKSKPEFRQVYELKDKVSKLNVEVKQGFKLRLNYSYSGNYLDIKVENPWEIETKLRMEMSESATNGGGKQTILSLSKALTPRVWMGSYLYTNEGKYSLVTSRYMGSGVSISVTGTTNYKFDPNTYEGQRIVLLGLAWSE